MPKSYKKKPLGNWPDTIKHDQTQPFEEVDSETIMGPEPESGSDEVADIDNIAESVGLYTQTKPGPDKPNTGPENPHEVNIAEEVDKAEKDRREG